MTTTRAFLGFCLLLVACRSAGGGPVDTDSGTTDDMTVTPPVDNGNNPPPQDVQPRRDAGPCDRMSGRENTATECSDGIDNDCNGFVDCEDFDCRNCSVPACLQNGGVPQRDGGVCMCATGGERSAAACSDGQDNDCDGFVDCGDFDCGCTDGGLPDRTPTTDRGPCTRTGAENTPMACSDGVDNDCNGFLDCNDFSCQSCSISVCLRDGGGLPLRDGGVCACRGPENTAAACSDGVDNDCNGFADCRDRACSCVGTCPAFAMGCTCMGPENSDTTCMDGRDNDCNSFTDCNDFNCSRSATVTVCGSDGGTRDASTTPDVSVAPMDAP